MTMNKLVIWGASGHAQVVADIVRLEGRFEIAGFLDDLNLQRRGEPFCGSTVLGGRAELPRLRESGVECILIAIGDGGVRLRLWRDAQKHQFRLATAVHPRAIVAGDVEIGAGSVVMAGAVLNPGVRTGENVVVNTAASIDHGCQIEDGATIGPQAALAGDVQVGRGALIGIGAVVRERVAIGAGTIVGAGAVVLRDLPPDVVAWGVPARIQRGGQTHAG